MRTATSFALHQGCRTRWRLAAALLAFTLNVSLLASLLLAFETAAPTVWLTPTTEILQMVTACERHLGRRARDECKQQVVARQLAGERRSVQLAGG